MKMTSLNRLGNVPWSGSTLRGLQGCFLWLIISLSACQKLRPEKIILPDYPDLEDVYISQYRMLGERPLEKEVMLDASKEVNSFEMDSSTWKDELSFLLEINPNKPEFIGVYNVTDEENKAVLRLIDGEINDLKYIHIEYSDDDFLNIEATIHEDKDVYTHHREIEVFFEDGLIKSWTISGYQKMMFKDTVWFGIVGKVN